MKKLTGRIRRHKTIRKRMFGTAEKPRLCVSRRNKSLYVQLVDDASGKTILGLSTKGYGGNVKAALALGEEFAKKAASKGFSKIIFDRAGYRYHGRVKAFAESARKGGLVF